MSLALGAGLWWVGIRLSRRTMAILEGRAGRDGYQLVEARRALVRFGPFRSYSNTRQPIFRIRVLTADGTRRTGWARVGTMWSTGMPEEVEIRLDDVETAGVPDRPHHH